MRARAEERAGTGTVQLREVFYARPADLFECFTDPGRVQAFTQSPATVRCQLAMLGVLCVLSCTPSEVLYAARVCKDTPAPACSLCGMFLRIDTRVWTSPPVQATHVEAAQWPVCSTVTAAMLR